MVKTVSDLNVENDKSYSNLGKNIDNRSKDGIYFFDLRKDIDDKTRMEKDYTLTETFEIFLFIFLRMAFMVCIITINFLALSISLNCNVNENPFKKFFAALFAFFFGFVYLIVNFYIYRVLTMKKICDINEDYLFPF